MAEYREIIRECTAHAGPSPASPALFELNPGTVVRMLRDEDKNYVRVAFAGRPVYVPRECVTEASEEAFHAYQSKTADASIVTFKADNVGGEPAGFADRLGALIIDVVLWNIVFVGTGTILTIASAPLGIRVAILSPLLVGLLTYVLYLNANGGTWGKRFVSIRIINVETGAAPGWGTAIVRQFAAFISGLPLYLGYFWMIWDKEKKTWHDHIAGTMVIRSNWHSVQS